MFYNIISILLYGGNMSSNISKQKRERMMQFLSKLKEEHKNDDSMLIALGEIEAELNAKKYGLVWEEHEEAVDVMMKDNIPVFTECANKEIHASDSDNYNFLLEGDNLHSLHLLEKTHKGKIDVIYIDPPYNTGSNDFIYDDNMIDNSDGFRHSKWLSFMSERLSIARNLLSNEGLILISINEIELYALKLLCDSIFGEINFLANFIWQSTPGSNTGLDIKTVTEYVICYAKNKTYCTTGANIIECDEGKYNLQDEFVERRGKYTLNKLDRRMTGQHYSDALNYQITMPDGTKLFPGNNIEKQSYWNWRWSQSKVQWGIDNGFIVFKQIKGNWAVYFKQYFKVNNKDELIQRAQPYQNLIKELDGINSARGTQEVMGIFNSKKFDYPKPINLLKYLLNVHANKNSKILDFFAGSGTTAQAVLELNKEDGGNRKFILCTNNENGICENITYQRIKTVITGKREDGSDYSDGIPANLKYYRTDFVSKNEENLSDALLEHVAEMIQLEHGIKLDGKRYITVMNDDEADRLAEHWSEYPDVKALYVSKNVLFTTEQNTLFKDVDIHIIPDYYFNFELREVGETW